MLVIRMARKGKLNIPSYAIVVVDKRVARQSAYLERLGTYSPRSKSQKVILKKDRIDYWMGQGAKVSDTVLSLLRRQGFLKK